MAWAFDFVPPPVGEFFILGLQRRWGRTFETPQGKLLLEQIKQSAEEMSTYAKVFEDLKATEEQLEELTYSKESLGADSISRRLQQDLSYLFDVYYKDPSVNEYLDTTVVQDTLIAVVREGSERKSKLHSQKILKDKEGRLKFASSIIHNSNWLYALTISVQVEFDSLSRYQTHKLYLLNEVQLLGESIETLIRGQANY